MTIKNIQLLGRNPSKKLTEAPYKKKDAPNGQPTPYRNDLKLIHQLQVLQLDMEMQQEQRYKESVSADEITRKQTELFEFTPNAYLALTNEGVIQEANLIAAHILGINREDLVQQSFVDYILPADREIFRKGWARLFNTNDSQVIIATVLRNDGHRSHVRIALSGTWMDEEFYVLLTMTDITPWKQVEEVHAFLLGESWSVSGIGFLQSLTEFLAKSLYMDYVTVERIYPDKKEVEVISAYGEEITPAPRYPISSSSYRKLLEQKFFCFPNGAHYLFPDNHLLQQYHAESFAGIVLMGREGKPIGMINIIGRTPLLDSRPIDMVLKQVSVRAAAELEHWQSGETILDSHLQHELLVEEKTAELQAVNEQLNEELKKRFKEIESLEIVKEKYRTIADLTYNWETWVNPAGEFIYVSPSCKRISGYSSEEFMQDPSLVIKITHPEDQQMVEKHFSKAATEGTISSFEYRINTRDGYERWIGHHCQQVFDSNGNYMGQRGSNQDITQRKVAEKILLDSQKHLRQLSQRMEEITEAERTRIAREIHDELGHLLTALKYDMEGIINRDEMIADDLKSELGMMMDMVDSLIDSVRKIATELRPGILDHLGLLPSIEWQIKQFRLRTKICCVLSIQEMDVSFDKNETNIIFRILQEILTNITRHAKANHVKVLLTNRDSCFHMEVTDNGIGFEYEDIPPMNTLGLIGMKERALSIGGEIQIDSKPGKGTMVRLLLPKISKLSINDLK